MSQHSYFYPITSYFGKNKKKIFGKILSIFQKLNCMHAIFIFLITHACHHFAVKIRHFTPSNKKVEALYPSIYNALLLVNQCIVVWYLLLIIIVSYIIVSWVSTYWLLSIELRRISTSIFNTADYIIDEPLVRCQPLVLSYLT